MMRKRWPVAIAMLAAIVLIAAAVFGWRDPTPDPSVTPRTAPQAEVGVADLAPGELSPAHLRTEPGAPVSAAAPSPAATTALPPMPASNATLAESVDVLLARARAGDGEAACRYLLQASRCASAEGRRAFAGQLAASMAKDQFDGPQGMAINMAARLEESAARTAGFCEGVDAANLPDADALLPDILGRLTPRQKLLLAMSRPDGSILRLPRNMGPGAASSFSTSTSYVVPQVYADNDLAFIEAGLDAADPLALEAALLLFAPGDQLLPMNHLRFSLPDPYRFALYARLMQRLHGDGAVGDFVAAALPKVLATMSPARKERLERELDQELHRWEQATMRAGEPRSLPSADADDAPGLCAD